MPVCVCVCGGGMLNNRDEKEKKERKKERKKLQEHLDSFQSPSPSCYTRTGVQLPAVLTVSTRNDSQCTYIYICSFLKHTTLHYKSADHEV